jgi:hypothetical protein
VIVGMDIGLHRPASANKKESRLLIGSSAWAVL